MLVQISRNVNYITLSWRRSIPVCVDLGCSHFFFSSGKPGLEREINQLRAPEWKAFRILFLNSWGPCLQLSHHICPSSSCSVIPALAFVHVLRCSTFLGADISFQVLFEKKKKHAKLQNIISGSFLRK